MKGVGKMELFFEFIIAGAVGITQHFFINFLLKPVLWAYDLFKMPTDEIFVIEEAAPAEKIATSYDVQGLDDLVNKAEHPSFEEWKVQKYQQKRTCCTNKKKGKLT